VKAQAEFISDGKIAGKYDKENIQAEIAKRIDEFGDNFPEVLDY